MSVSRQSQPPLQVEPERLIDQPGPARDLLVRSAQAWGEGLDEREAWQRVTGAVRGPAHKDRRRRRRALVLGIAAAATLSLVPVLIRTGFRPSWLFALRSPNVQPERAQRSLLPVGPTRLEEGVVIDIRENTIAWLPAKGDDAQPIKLDSGSLQVRVVHGDSHARPFVVASGPYRFQDVGTVFQISADAQTVHLDVADGAVQVLAGSKTLAIVQAGAHWRGPADPESSPDKGSSPLPVTAPATHDPLLPRASAESGGPPVPTGPQGTLPAPSSRSLSNSTQGTSRAPGGPLPPSTSPPQSSQLAGSNHGPASTTLGTPSEHTHEDRDPLAPGSAAAALDLATAQPSDATPDCLALARRGRPRDALNCFQKVARGQDLAAQMALHEVARLDRDVFGDRQGALAALSEYRERFPQGALRGEVELSRIELLVETHQVATVLADSEALLGTAFGRERAADLHLLRGNLYREALGDCARAKREYELIPSSRGAATTEALYGRARCLEMAGHPGEAAKMYEEYAARPHAARAAEARARARALAP